MSEELVALYLNLFLDHHTLWRFILGVAEVNLCIISMEYVIALLCLLSLSWTDVDSSLVGRRSVELIVFDVLKEKVSLHQPLPRFIAGLCH